MNLKKLLERPFVLLTTLLRHLLGNKNAESVRTLPLMVPMAGP